MRTSTTVLKSLGNITRKHCIHFRFSADDTQLCLSMKADNIRQLVKLQSRLKDLKAWM